MKPNLDTELELLRQRREQLESTLQAQRDAFNPGPVYAREQTELEHDEEVKSYKDRRGN